MSAASHPIHAPAPRPEVVAPPPAPVQPAPRRPWKWLVFLLIIGGAGWMAYNSRTAPAPAATAPVIVARMATVTTGTLDQTLRLTGQTGPIDFANITAPLLRGDGGRAMVLMKVAPSGSWVKKGTQVAQIDAQPIIDRLDDMSDSIEAAEADIRKRQAEQAIEWETLEQSIRVARSDVDKARLDFKVAEVRTDVERQLLKLNLEETEARFKQLQSDLNQKKVAHAADVKILEINLARTSKRRERLQRDLEKYTITAPMEGLVVMSSIVRNSEMSQVQQGDQLMPGQPFMKIVNTNKMKVDATVNQTQSSDLRIGQHVRIKLDAFADLTLPGQVQSIGALATGSARQGYFIRTVPVQILIQGTDKRLIPDLSASADVILARGERPGPIAPLSAIRTEDGKTVAYVKKGEGFERREVSVGIHNDTQAMILSGLQAGDQVRLN